MKGIWWIYILGPETGWPVKIGYTKNMMTRAKELQVGCWEQLTLHKRYAVVSKSIALKVERLAHKKLESKRMIGEWFNIFGEDAIKVIDEVVGYQKYLEPSLEIQEKLEEQLSA